MNEFIGSMDITAKGCNLYYGDFHALKNINIEIPEKQVTALIGPSGCGKSTFLKNWVKFQQAFEKSYGDSLRITAADAFIVLLEKYRFDQLNQMDPWVLARIYQSAWRDLYDLSYSDSNNVKESISITGHLQTA